MTQVIANQGCGIRAAMRTGLSLVMAGFLIGAGAVTVQAAEPETDPRDFSTKVPHTESGTENLDDLRASDPGSPRVSDEIEFRIPVLNVPGDPASGERTDVRPGSIAVSADGKYAYSDYSKYPMHEYYIFDLEKRLHIETMEQEVQSDWNGEPRAARDANILAYIETESHVVVRDTTTQAEIARHAVPDRPGARVAISHDGTEFYMIGIDGWSSSTLRKVNLETGELTEGPTFDFLPNGSIALSPDGTTLAVGLGGGYEDANLTLIDAESLAIIGGPYENKKLWQFEGLTFDHTGTALYTTAYSNTLAKLDSADGQNITRITAGKGLASVLPVPGRDRAWAAAYNDSLITVADFENGVRSASYREVPGGPSGMVQSSTGDIVVATGGNSDKNGADNSIMVYLAPRATVQPVDATISGLGETVEFTASIVGVKADAGSDVTWQSSPDGVTWTDLDEHTTTLQLTADAEAVALQYRMSFTDEFWGQTNTTNVVRILGEQPVITSPAVSLTTKPGEAISPFQATATAQPGFTWSAEGLPEGVTIDPQTGVLSGTPADEGRFAIVLTVTDAFGSASQDGVITVTSEDAGNDADADADADGNADTGSNGNADAGSNGGTGGAGDSSANGKGDGADPLPNTGSEGVLFFAAAGIMLLGAGALLFIPRRRS